MPRQRAEQPKTHPNPPYTSQSRHHRPKHRRVQHRRRARNHGKGDHNHKTTKSSPKPSTPPTSQIHHHHLHRRRRRVSDASPTKSRRRGTNRTFRLGSPRLAASSSASPMQLLRCDSARQREKRKKKEKKERSFQVVAMQRRPGRVPVSRTWRGVTALRVGLPPGRGARGPRHVGRSCALVWGDGWCGLGLVHGPGAGRVLVAAGGIGRLVRG